MSVDESPVAGSGIGPARPDPEEPTLADLAEEDTQRLRRLAWRRGAVPRGRRRWPTPRFSRLGLLTYAVTQAVLLFWWVAFYPGTMSYDTVMYVWQVSTSHWDTQHSVLYDGLVWLSLRTTGQLAALTLAQTILMAAGMAYVVTGLRRLGVPGRWLAAAAIVAACLPMVGTFTVYASKDVGFVLTQVWLVGTVARLLARRPRPSRMLWAALLAELVAMGLFRQNGFEVVAVTGALLVAFLAGMRWPAAVCGTAGVAVALVANLVVYPGMGLPAPRSYLVLSTAYADIAVAYSHRPGSFTASEKRLMQSVAPLDFWAHSANCYTVDTTVSTGHPQFDLGAADRHRGQLFELWLTLFKRMPDEIVQARICRGAIAWNPFPAPPAGWTVKVPISGAASYYDFPVSKISQSPYRAAIRSEPLSGTAHAVGVFARRFTDARSLEWIAWRGATWALLAYLAVGLFARRRRDPTVLALVAVIVGNQLAVLSNNTAQLVRYMAGPLILGILLLPLAFVSRERLAGARTPAAGT